MALNELKAVSNSLTFGLFLGLHIPPFLLVLIMPELLQQDRLSRLSWDEHFSITRLWNMHSHGLLPIMGFITQFESLSVPGTVFSNITEQAEEPVFILFSFPSKFHSYRIVFLTLELWKSGICFTFFHFCVQGFRLSFLSRVFNNVL